ncbi:alpha/beta hydrolase family protein [Nonomuraea salmonea]|uniref:Alpha/beta hydrolase family protein n=1 Tax=Nonomuraea salmonea TaxID=46181 RepID=A0ABV5P390_9ACTN
MTDFVLIPGAWSGAWVWDPVADALRERGHRAHSVTLTGLEPDAEEPSRVGLDDHVKDGLAMLSGLDDVILVAHDYGGMVAGLVADHVPEQVTHSIYIEGFVPRDGLSTLDGLPDNQLAAERALIEAAGGLWPAPDHELLSDVPDLSDRDARRLAERLVPHPGRTLIEPVTVKHPIGPATYVVCDLDHTHGLLCPAIQALRSEPGWTFRTLDAGYWPMVSVPGQLAALLDEIAFEIA